MTVLYIITRYVTFCGALLRAFWEHVACRLCLVPVEDVRPLRADELCGHVEHDLTRSLKQAFLVCWLPFTMNFFIGCSFLLTGAYRLFYLVETTSLQAYGLVWLGVSFLANCTCSFEDVLSFKEQLYGGKSKFLKVVLSPFFWVCYASSFLERYSITFVLSVAFAVVFPHIFNLLFPAIESLIKLIS